MGMFVEGYLVGCTPLGKPEQGKEQMLAYTIQDTDDASNKQRVLTKAQIGVQGEFVKVPVSVSVDKRNGVLQDGVTVWAEVERASQAPPDWFTQGKPTGPKPLAPTAEQAKIAQSMTPAQPVGASSNGSGNGGRP